MNDYSKTCNFNALLQEDERNCKFFRNLCQKKKKRIDVQEFNAFNLTKFLEGTLHYNIVEITKWFYHSFWAKISWNEHPYSAQELLYNKMISRNILKVRRQLC